MSQTIPVAELVFDESFQLKPEVSFGTDANSVLSGRKRVPPGGVRVDFPFSGEVCGPRIQGTIQGTDYALLRSDGISRLDVRAVITTDRGERIALAADGVARFEHGSTIAQLRESIRLHSTSDQYAWVNRFQVWATGELDLSTGRATLSAYSA